MKIIELATTRPVKRPPHQSKCFGCKKLLSQEGVRYHSGTVDTNYPLPPPTMTDTENITWLWCDDCYDKLRGMEN